MSAQHKAAIRKAYRGLSLEQRFWAKVNKTDTCWLWTAYIMPIGYGRFGIGNVSHLAHVVSLGIAGRKIPAGMVCDHLCKVRHCVNPDHIRVVTRPINATENNDSPMARNRRKTRCKEGHDYTPENTAMRWGACGRYGSRTKNRICLTCFPSYWPYAMVERQPPKGAKPGRKWLGPLSNTPRPHTPTGRKPGRPAKKTSPLAQGNQ